MQDYLRPIPISDPANIAGALPLAGGWARFTHVELLSRGDAPRVLPASSLSPEQLAPLIAPRADVAEISLDRPRLMGILNVTPDSFSDGGRHLAPLAALAQARAMAEAGADLIDIGGESTRPGAAEMPVAEEVDRVVPVICAMRAAGLTLPISIDTRKSPVAKAALAAGGSVLNDVSGLRFDPDLAEVAAHHDVPLIVMHSIGTPETMQASAAAAYDDVLLDVYDSLAAIVAGAVRAGVARTRIMVDPGIGFGKTPAQNQALLARLSLFHGLGCGILLGVSRKGFVGTIGREPRADRRDAASAAVGLWAVSQGIQMLRVHDIETHRQMIALWQHARGATEKRADT